MTQQNDPYRWERLRSSYDDSAAPIIGVALIMAFVIALIVMASPGGDTPRVTENTSRTERPVPPTPTTAPAAKPEPKPMPTTPQ